MTCASIVSTNSTGGHLLSINYNERFNRDLKHAFPDYLLTYKLIDTLFSH